MSSAERIAANLSRAAAGALVFALPMLMTMEMWWLGFYMDRLRLIFLILLTLPVLIGLSHYSGFEETFGWREDLRDALIAVAVGTAMSGIVLWLFGVLTSEMPLSEIMGKAVIQIVPASIGALLARSQFGSREQKDEENERLKPGYFGTLFLMGVGTLFLSLNVAPTEEMVLIAYMMSPGHAFLLAIFTMIVMHIFVYAANFRGRVVRPPDVAFWRLFLRYTVAGYALVLLVSLLVLWLFGRTDGLSFAESLNSAVVLGFPGAIGAAAARLIL